jgi:hypothetical protein
MRHKPEKKVKVVVKAVHKHHLFMWDYGRDLLRSLSRPAMIFLFFVTLTLIFSAAGLFHVLEGSHVNPKLMDFFDSVYFTVTTMSGVGYGDIVPTTKAGKALSMLMMIAGTALFASYTAVIAASIIEIEAKKKGQ